MIESKSSIRFVRFNSLSCPPCRLIDVVMGGDYGYKFRYGRSGLHPYTAWNGEIPGTLPMVAGTGLGR